MSMVYSYLTLTILYVLYSLYVYSSYDLSTYFVLHQDTYLYINTHWNLCVLFPTCTGSIRTASFLLCFQSFLSVSCALLICILGCVLSFGLFYGVICWLTFYTSLWPYSLFQSLVTMVTWILFPSFGLIYILLYMKMVVFLGFLYLSFTFYTSYHPYYP